MTDLTTLLDLKARLARTWPAFFERHGTFTATQVAVIPALLDGQNVMVCVPTASGKTTAVLAPLIERHCPPNRAPKTLRLLYLTPTRALVNDLAMRLAHPLDTLRVKLGVKTSDSSFRPARPPDLLITTPESADSLLAAHARLFANVRAVVIDELHLFDGTPRGDQVRPILSRIERIRAYAFAQGDAPDATMQYAALSAMVADPAGAAARYFTAAQVIAVPGKRALETELVAMEAESSAALRAYLETFRARGWRKALAFCNSRAEVEAYAAVVRANSPFGDAVYVHYSNIEPQRRRAIEQQFALAEAAICFATTTLELGIDVGDIDVVLLIGPPGSAHSFVQRIGRGNRRGNVTRVTCVYRSTLERLLFAALLDEPAGSTIEQRAPEQRSIAAPVQALDQTAQHPTTGASFRTAVAIQQIFSLLKQSPTAAMRLAELTALFAGMLAPDDLATIVGQLQRLDYLKVGRPGEWRAGDRLNKLYDEQFKDQNSLSIYSNIAHSPGALIAIRDQHTQQTVAKVDALWLDREVLTLEGRPVNVEWCDGEALWVSSYRGRDPARQLIYRSTRQLLHYDLARRLPSQLGLQPGDAPLVAAPEGWWWFHCLGDLFGRAALDLLRYRLPARETAQPGLCLHLIGEAQALPNWSESQVIRYLEDNYRRYETLLDGGPFQHLLPVKLRRRTVVEQFDAARFLVAVTALRPIVAREELGEELLQLLKI
jgi:ATP-dependent Lhr-like helicase